MVGSCCNDTCAIEALQKHQKGTLIKVLWLNAVMFVVIILAAFFGKSTSLLTDGLDNLGDALTYGLSLYVIAESNQAKAKVALFKGALIFAAGIFVVAEIIYKLLNPVVPIFEIMGLFSLMSLSANGLCLFLLWKHRKDDINMSSVYECSRNDITTNISVFITAGAVWFFDSGWPDLIVAGLLASILLNSSFRVIRSALKEMSTSQAHKA